VFCASAGLLIDHDLAEAISAGRFPLIEEWSVELQQQWRRREGDAPLVLLVAGLRWRPAGGRDPAQPYCCALPTLLRPVLEELAGKLDAQLLELEGSRSTEGLGRDDLLEAPLLLVASERPAEELLGGGLLREQPGQLLSLWRSSGTAGRLLREWRRGFGVLKEADLEVELPAPLIALQQLEQGQASAIGRFLVIQAVLLAVALLLGLLLFRWSGRVAPGLVLIGATWWWLGRRPGLQERNWRWCRDQLLQLQRLWADFGIRARVRDELHESGPVGRKPPLLLQALQAHRLHLELLHRRSGPWQRADLIDALHLFENLQAQLNRLEHRHRQRRRLLQSLAALLGLMLLLAIVLAQSWSDGLVLPTAALLALFSQQQPVPVLLPLRRQRAVKALEGPVALLRRAQRSDDLSTADGLRQEVEQAVLTAGRELVDVVNDSLSSGNAEAGM